MSGSKRIQTFFAEVSRRRVGRVAIGYVVTAWVLIEVADVVFPRLALPGWSVTLLIIVAAAGLPIALVLAWVYDVVPDHEAGAARKPTPRWVALSAVLLVAALTLAGSVRVWSGITQRTVRIHSIAVLPFTSLSSDPEQQYFVDGMHDALISELAQIGAIRVVSRTSTLRYRDTEKPVPQIARELGVDGIVEGSVLKVGDELRVQVQLIQAQPREHHVWAGGYDRTVRDVYAVHSEIARRIAAEIHAGVTPSEERRLAAARPVNPVAYEQYLRGMFFLRQQTPEGYEKGLEYLHRSVDVDPADPNTHAGLALGYSLIGHGTIPDAFERAMSAAHRALLLDSTVAAAHEAIAEYKLYREWDWPGAERSFQKALMLNPNMAGAAAHYAWYLELMRRPQEALEWMRRATSLDPLNPTWPAWIAWLYWDAGRWDETLVNARLALELDPNHPHPLYLFATASAMRADTAAALEAARRMVQSNPVWAWGLAHTHLLLGQEQAARAVVARVKARPPNPMSAWGLAVVYAGLGETESAMKWLELAYELRFSWMPWIDQWPLEGLQGNVRFQEIREELRLPGTQLPLMADAGRRTPEA